MNLTDKNIQALLSGIIFFICYSVLLGYTLGPQSSLDTFWHLQMGKDLLENGLSPWVDHYSFTFYHKEISSTPVFFQIIIATLVSTFGDVSGFILFKILYITLLLFFLYRFFKQIKTHWFILFLILPILTYFIEMRLIVRPETISNILIIICLSFYLKARKNFATKELVSICLLMLFWVNYHTPIIGYIIIFGLFLDRAIHKLLYKNTGFTWSQWLTWAAAVFFIGFVNPTLEHAVFSTLSMSNEWSQYLSEYAPSYVAYSTDKMVYLLWISTIAAVCLAILKKHYGLAFIAILMGYFSLNILRLLPAASLINFCILATLLSSLDYSRLSQSIRPSIRITLTAGYLSIFLFSMGQISDHTFARLSTLSNYPQHVEDMRQQMDERYPAQISDYLNNFQVAGNVLNTFNVGGYLIYKLTNEFKVFIDGRTHILYPVEHYKHYLDVISDIHSLEEDVKKYGIQYAVFENTTRAQRYFSGTDALTINFADENYALFTQEKETSFPIASKLTLFPTCWNDQLIKQTEKEIALSTALFSDKKYTLRFILELLDGYISDENKKSFFDTLQLTDLRSDITRRLAAHLAVKNESYQKASDLFKSIQKKTQDDYLMLAYASTMTQDYGTAKAAMILYFRDKGDLSNNSISDFDKILLLKVLEPQTHDTQTLLSGTDIIEIKNGLNMSDELISQARSAGLPYNTGCADIFRP